MEWLNELLSSTPVVTFIYTLCLTMFGRLVIKVYNWGKMDKKGLVTKQEFKEFEKNMRSDMREYRQEIQDVVMQTCLREVDKSTKEIKEFRRTAEEMKVQSKVSEERMKSYDEKMGRLDNIEEEQRYMNSKIKRMTTTEQSSGRRSDN